MRMVAVGIEWKGQNLSISEYQRTLEYFFRIFIYLFIQAAPGLSCGMQDLHCSMWDLQLWHVDSQLWHVGSYFWPAAFLVVACRLLSCGMWTSQLQHACGIQFPDQGSNPGPLHQEHEVLPTGPRGKSLQSVNIQKNTGGLAAFEEIPRSSMRSYSRARVSVSQATKNTKRSAGYLTCLFIH